MSDDDAEHAYRLLETGSEFIAGATDAIEIAMLLSGRSVAACKEGLARLQLSGLCSFAPPRVDGPGSAAAGVQWKRGDGTATRATQTGSLVDKMDVFSDLLHEDSVGTTSDGQGSGESG